MSGAPGSAAAVHTTTIDRRNPDHQEPMKGGRRAGDPPLTTRECADWMGVGTDYIVAAIRDGYLEAERFGPPGARPLYRVHLDSFVAYLKAIGFRRLPRHTDL